jgi:hypothetical protein
LQRLSVIVEATDFGPAQYSVLPNMPDLLRLEATGLLVLGQCCHHGGIDKLRDVAAQG